MPSLIEKYGMEREAASMALEEGKEWSSLSKKEKEDYYSKVRSERKTGGNKEDGGIIPANDMMRRLGR